MRPKGGDHTVQDTTVVELVAGDPGRPSEWAGSASGAPAEDANPGFAATGPDQPRTGCGLPCPSGGTPAEREQRMDHDLLVYLRARNELERISAEDGAETDRWLAANDAVGKAYDRLPKWRRLLLPLTEDRDRSALTG